MKSKKTKKALSGSVLALVLCFVMLIGTTFAWFTSSDSTAVNSIQAGTLKVELLDMDGQDLTSSGLAWQKASGHENDAVLWEPGATYKTQTFQIANKGNLALKYTILVSGATGNTELLDVIDFKIVDRTDANKSVALAGFTGNLAAGSEENPTTGSYYIEGTMKTTAGNAYQGKKLDSIAITVYATQDTVEYDSYNNTYDKDAILPDANAVPVADATELAAAIAKGGSIVLTKDITASDVVNIAKDVTIYGNGNTITAATGKDRVFNVENTTNDISIKLYGLNIENNNNISYDRGISFYNNSGKIQLEMDSCTVKTQHYAVNVAKDNSDITVNVKNSDITGYAAAQTWSANSKLTFENCTLTGVNKWDDPEANQGDNDYGTIVVIDSATNATLTFNNCVIKNVENGTADQTFFSVRNNSAKITATGCTFIDNGTTIATSDLSNHCDFENDATYGSAITVN